MGKLFLIVAGVLLGVMLSRLLRQKLRRGARDPSAAPRTMVQVGDERIDNPEIRDLIRQNRKIEAIKLVREKTGLGLAEAKDAVEALERKLR